jgi:hypothetical protein
MSNLSEEEKKTAIKDAKQGDANAIAILINDQLQPKGIISKIFRKDSLLQILLEYAETPNQKACCSFLEKGIIKINPQGIHTVKIYGKSQNDKVAEWNYSFQLYQDEDLLNFQDVLESAKADPESPKTDSQTERDRRTFENLKRHNLSDKKIADYFNPEKPHFGCLIYWLWLFFGLCALATLSQLFRGNLDSVLKLSLLSLVTFPPIPAFLGKIIAPKLPKYRLFTKGIRDLLYSFSLILFLSFVSQFITSNSSKSSPRTTDTPSTIQRTNQSGSDTRRREPSNSDQLGRCQDEQIARGATVEEILEACSPSEPEEITPIPQEEIEKAFCSEIKGDPSHPWYSDCLQRGY